MKNITKSLLLICTLIACGLSELLEARGGGGGRTGGGRSFHGGGMRSGGMRTSHIRSSGPSRTSRIGGYKTAKAGSFSRSGFAGKYQGGKYAHGRYGRHYLGYGNRHWVHRYPYRYGLYPWGAFLLTAPWWYSWNWDNYYTRYPYMRDEIEELRAELNASLAAMRQKDRRLAALEDRLDEALGTNAQEGLKRKISQLKKELRKQAEITKILDAKLKEKVGKN